MTLDPNNNVLNIKLATPMTSSLLIAPTQQMACLSLKPFALITSAFVNAAIDFSRTANSAAKRLKSLLAFKALKLGALCSPAVIRGHVSYGSQNAEIDVAIDYGDSVHLIFTAKQAGANVSSFNFKMRCYLVANADHFPRLEICPDTKSRDLRLVFLFTKFNSINGACSQAVQHRSTRRSQFFAGIVMNASCPFTIQRTAKRKQNQILS